MASLVDCHWSSKALVCNYNVIEKDENFASGHFDIQNTDISTVGNFQQMTVSGDSVHCRWITPSRTKTDHFLQFVNHLSEWTTITIQDDTIITLSFQTDTFNKEDSSRGKPSPQGMKIAKVYKQIGLLSYHHINKIDIDFLHTRQHEEQLSAKSKKNINVLPVVTAQILFCSNLLKIMSLLNFELPDG